MKKDLRAKAAQKQNQQAKNKAPQSIDPKAADAIRQAAKKYEGKSENELLSELKNGMQQGKFTPHQLEEFAGRAGAMLNADQRKKLNEVLQFLNQ